MKRLFALALCAACLTGMLTGCQKEETEPQYEILKPVIYLYPEQTTAVTVRLDYKGKFTCTYPDYPAGGWQVTARPDGTLTNKADGREYSYLFLSLIHIF